jgi:hypothetical protein
MQMKFGKYKGWEIDDIPAQYLRVLVDHVPIKDEDLEAAILARIEFDEDAGPSHMNW